jgi:hypothetical protein
VTILAGFSPDESGTAALHLGALLARSASDRLAVCTVATMIWPPNAHGIDMKYRAYVGELAEHALVEAKARTPADVDATFLVHHARSVPVVPGDVAVVRKPVEQADGGGVLGQNRSQDSNGQCELMPRARRS